MECVEEVLNELTVLGWLPLLIERVADDQTFDLLAAYHVSDNATHTGHVAIHSHHVGFEFYCLKRFCDDELRV